MRAAAVLLVLFAQGCNGCNDDRAASAPPKDAQSEAAKIDAAQTPLDASVVDASASFDELPDASASSDLDTRARHLLEAISQNDSSLAADIMLPRDAFIGARDAQDPATLYDTKFKNAWAAQISRVHRREKGIEQAVFVSFALGPDPQRAVPRRHEWKEPVWRVNHSTLTFTIDGRVQRIEIGEMIAWRGNWYVAHLR